MPKAESDPMMAEYGSFTADIEKSGHYLGGNPLQPIALSAQEPERRFLAGRMAALLG